MKKIKLLFTYLIAFFCVGSVFVVPQNDGMMNPVFKSQYENQGIIFVMDEDQMIVPITVNYQKNEEVKENIQTLIQLMKQNVEFTSFTTLLPQALQLSQVEIEGKEVTLFFNEALYMMNSSIELRVIEALVGVVLQFDRSYVVNFAVNGEKTEKMPLSQLPLVALDQHLGLNNFKLMQPDLHQTKSLQEVIVKENDHQSYYVIQTRRIAQGLDEKAIVQLMMEPIAPYIRTCKIVDHCVDIEINQRAMLDENTVNLDVFHPFLISLVLMEPIQKIQFTLDNEMVQVIENVEQNLGIQQFALNPFEL